MCGSNGSLRAHGHSVIPWRGPVAVLLPLRHAATYSLRPPAVCSIEIARLKLLHGACDRCVAHGRCVAFKWQQCVAHALMFKAPGLRSDRRDTWLRYVCMSVHV